MLIFGARGARSFTLAALGVALASGLTAACGAGVVVVDAAAPPSSASAGQAADHAVAAVRPPDPLAPATYHRVVRHGPAAKTVVRPVTGNSGSDRSVRYADGVTVAVDRVGHSVEEGSGPGTYPGRPHTALTLTLINHSAESVNLDQVVVTALYGSPARVASPVYEDPTAGDFSGTVAPGASATATYVFSVPTGAAASLVAIVDFDGGHDAARLSGGA